MVVGMAVPQVFKRGDMWAVLAWTGVILGATVSAKLAFMAAMAHA